MTISNRRAYVLSFGLAGLFGLVACGSEEPTPSATGGGGGTAPQGGSATGGTAGAGVTGGSAGVGVTGGSAGAGMTGGSGGAATGGGAGSGGSDVAGGGGAGAGAGGAGGGAGASGAAGGGAGGAAGAAGQAGGGAGGAGGSMGGAAGKAGGGGAGGAGGGTGGASNCAGKALSLSANATGSASDSGSRARVMADLGSDLPTGTTARTIEYWAFVRSTDWVGETNTMFEYGLVMTNAGFGLDFGTTRPNMDPYTNGSFDGEGTPSGLTSMQTMTDQWVHFAMTWDGTSVRLFVNGTLQGTKTVNGAQLATATSQITIGGNPRGAYFGGLIDEFRVWRVAHDQAAIMSTKNRTLVGNETGLVAYYKFDESSGTSAADSVTTGGHTPHNGVLMAQSAGMNPTFVTPPTPLTLACP